MTRQKEKMKVRSIETLEKDLTDIFKTALRAKKLWLELEGKIWELELSMEYQSKLDLFLDTSPGGTTEARKMINTSLLKKKTQLKKGTITQIKLKRF